MRTRILLNPTPTEGGGAGTAQAQQATTQQQAATAPTMVPLTVEEYQRLRGVETQFATVQTKLNADLSTKEAERIQALHDKGETQKAMEELRKSLTKQYDDEKTSRLKVEQQYHGEKKSAALSTALMGVSFASDAAAGQLKMILDGSFETRVDGNGSIMVVDKITGLPAVDVIKQKLASPEFAHFLKPNTQGGAGGGGGTPPAQQAAVGGDVMSQLLGDFDWRQSRLSTKN